MGGRELAGAGVALLPCSPCPCTPCATPLHLPGEPPALLPPAQAACGGVGSFAVLSQPFNTSRWRTLSAAWRTGPTCWASWRSTAAMILRCSARVCGVWQPPWQPLRWCLCWHPTLAQCRRMPAGRPAACGAQVLCNGNALTLVSPARLRPCRRRPGDPAADAAAGGDAAGARHGVRQDCLQLPCSRPGAAAGATWRHWRPSPGRGRTCCHRPAVPAPPPCPSISLQLPPWPPPAWALWLAPADQRSCCSACGWRPCAVQEEAQARGHRVLTPLVSLDTPGKAAVQVCLCGRGG